MKKISEANLKSSKSSLKSPVRRKKTNKLTNLTPKKSASTNKSSEDERFKSNLNDEFIDFTLKSMDCDINENTTKP